jgi:hypothetical protein
MKFNDYDLFTVGETLYLVKDVDLYIDDVTVKTFKEDAELEVIEIIREGGYGFANVDIEGYVIKLGLDELYDMVFD